MKLFQITSCQSGCIDGQPFEADSIEEAKTMVLEWYGISIEEVNKAISQKEQVRWIIKT